MDEGTGARAAREGHPDGVVPAPDGRIHDNVVRTLGSWVLAGRYRPGETLPREDDLAASLGVSRTSIREAVKALAAKGLLETRPRVGVRVQSRLDWRLLDPDVLSWHPDLAGDLELVESLIETRRIIEPAAAELAARRARPADVDRLDAAYQAMERAIPDDLDACCEADLAFHSTIIAASHNVVLRTMIGTVETILKTSFRLTTSLMDNQARTLGVHRRVLDAIRVRDTAGARSAMNSLLDVAAEDYRKLR